MHWLGVPVGKDRINPPTLFDAKPLGFTQVVRSAPGPTIYISGQTAWDVNRQLIGDGDFGTQARDALKNVGHALAAAGARPADVVQLRVYIVDYQMEHLHALAEAVVEFFGPDHLPASTLIGVQRLAFPEFLIEIEAVAQL